MFYRHPDPDALWSTVHSAPAVGAAAAATGTSPSSGSGSGPQELATRLVPPETRPVDELEPLCAMALRQVRHHLLDGRRTCRSRWRCVVSPTSTSPATRHAGARSPVRWWPSSPRSTPPDDVLLAFCAGQRERAAWEWAKWLPHALHPNKFDAVGPIRLVAPTASPRWRRCSTTCWPTGPASTRRPRRWRGRRTWWWSSTAATPRAPTHLMIEGGVEGVTLIDLTGRPPRVLDSTTLVLDRRRGRLPGQQHDGRRGRDRACRRARPTPPAAVLARALAPLRLSSAATRRAAAVHVDWGWPTCSASATRTTFDLRTRWAGRSNRDRLRVPIGRLRGRPPDGARPQGVRTGRHGPARPARRRDRLRQVASCCARWCWRWRSRTDSEILNFVLVDFKGGATFTKLDRLPHTSAVITNLADELHLVDRMLDAIGGELIRRQELLRRAGNYALAARLREGPHRRGAAGAAAAPAGGGRRVLRAAHRPTRLHRHVRPDRTRRPVARRAPAARLAAAGGGPAARAGHPPVVPDRAAHVLLHGEPRVLGVAGRLRAAPCAGQRFPAGRHGRAGPVQGGVRVRRAARRDHGAEGPRGPAHRPRAASTPPGTCGHASPRSRPSRPPSRTRSARPCSTCWCPEWRVRAGLPTRCGCRRWPSRRRWTSCSARWSRTPDRGLTIGSRRRTGARCAPRPASSTGRSEQRRDVCWLDLSGAGGQRRRGRRPAERQEHGAARDHRQPRAHPHPGGGAVLLPRLRRRRPGRRCVTCRTSAASRPGGTQNQVRRSIAEARTACSPSASSGSPSTAWTAWPRTGGCCGQGGSPKTGSATCSSSSTAGARCARSSRTWSRVVTELREPRPGVRRARRRRREPLDGGADERPGHVRQPAGAAARRPDRLGRSAAGRPRACPS